MFLTREEILKARSRTHPVEVPELGGQVLLRPLSVAALGRFMEARDRLTAYQLYPFLVALSAVGDDGSLLFSEEDATALGEVGFDALKRIGDEILTLNKIKDEDEGGPKNSPSPTTPSGSGSLPLLSGSAAPSAS